ncbi:MAG: hypothetical protein AAF531_22925 [Actinomycetota bacterium]
MSNQQQKNNGKRRSGRADQQANRNSSNGNGKNPNSKNPNSNNSNSGNGKGDGNKGGAKSSNSRRRKGSRKKKVDPRVFWGNPELLEEYDPPGATITTKPAAAVLSLGRPPLSGQQNASEHYFSAVYSRAVNLAAALAAAGELIEPDELTEGG